MAVNKVIYDNVPIMDITDSTVTADTLAKGSTAYNKSGEKITGTMELILSATDDGQGNVTLVTNGDITIGG